MIHRSRIQILNDTPARTGDYVLYRMQASQRAAFNHALEFAIGRANVSQLPCVVCFGLMDDYPEANARHYAFMLEGLRDVAMALRKRGIRFVVRRGSPGDVAVHFARSAAEVVCDRGYLRHQKLWREHLVKHAKCRVTQVESDVVVPVQVTSDHLEFAARTIRPKIHKQIDKFLRPVSVVKAKRSSLNLKVAGDIDVGDPSRALPKLKVDGSVAPTSFFTGGHGEAKKRLDAFIRNRLAGYADGRNEPSLGQTSTLAPYLHFGQISPIEIALRVRDARTGSKRDRDAFLEELIVRRELDMNFVNYCANYDEYESLPAWARKTLKLHAKDRRPTIFSREQLERCETYDPFWNAAQREMVITGFMHNYMRMYWGKKILEWTKSPKHAFETALYLNNKYFLCGRDPVSYANVAWLFGLHDRPWGPARKIFGTVRYMNDAGLQRKFDMDAYVEKVNALKA